MIKMNNTKRWLKNLLRMGDQGECISARPKPKELPKVGQSVPGSRLNRDLDDICIKHHGCLPPEAFDEDYI